MVDFKRMDSRPTQTMGGTDQHESSPRPTKTIGGTGQSRPTQNMQGQGADVYRTHISLGTVINGYELTGVIAENTGEASLFLCEKGGTSYVVKVYHREKKPKQEILAIIKTINSPYVIKIIEDGEIEGRYFEILPYFQDGDLQRASPLAAEYIISTVVSNVNEALCALHDKGIIHRDIKPNNLLFGNARKHVVVGDFGISSILTSGMSLRMSSASRTIGYGAPETISGFVSKESDYYSLGITLLHLATGADPFLGMTDTQILMLTMNYKIDVPQTLNPRIAHLIKGLTVKERKDRWGYSEINKWLNNETVEIRESIRQRSDIKPYILEGRELLGLEELSLALAEHWHEGIKHLYRGFIKDYLKQFGQDIASKAMDLEEERDKNLGLFKLIYTMNPNAPLCWQGELFMDLEKFGDAIKKNLPSINNSYFDLLQSGALLYFVEKKGCDPDLIDEVKRLQEMAKKDKEAAYFRLNYLMTQSDEFHFNNVVFESVDELVEYIYEQRNSIERISNNLLGSKYFFAWMEHLGFEKQISEWQKISY